jgi:hypothetical protein
LAWPPSTDRLRHARPWRQPRPASGTALLGYADQLLELLDHLQLPKAAVIGFSMGGLVAGVCPALPAAPAKPGGAQQRVQPQRAQRGVIARTRRPPSMGPDANAEACRAGSAANTGGQPGADRRRQTLAGNDPQGY